LLPTLNEIRRLQQLEDENAELKEQIAELRQLLQPQMKFPAHWKLTRLQSALLSVLVARESASREQLQSVRCDHAREHYPDEKGVDVQIYHIRKKLEPSGLKIETVWGQGYRLLPESRREIREFVTA